MPFVDQVDDCTGDEGLYSRIFGDLTTGETGPFDQSYASTLLSDGRLNSSDAPMPALKIVFNSSGGMGGFANSCLNDKDDVYNRNFDADEPRSELAKSRAVRTRRSTASRTERPDDAHALYAPYYSQYIPATSRIRSERRLESMVRSTPSTPDSPTTSPASAGMGSTRTGRSPTSSSQNVANDTNCRLRVNPLYKPICRQTNGFPTRMIDLHR